MIHTFATTDEQVRNAFDDLVVGERREALVDLVMKMRGYIASDTALKRTVAAACLEATLDVYGKMLKQANQPK